MINIGDIQEDQMVYIIFNTFDSNGASVTVTNLAAGDVKIHANGAVAQRTSSNGITVSIDFDGITGNHLIAIDTSDNSDDGFYAIETDYDVRLEGITVDAQTLNAWVAKFSIVNRNAMWDRLLTGATHNISTSAGRRLRAIQEFQGYSNGAIWIDTINGVAGIIDYENGTVENPVNTLADARTLSDSLKIKRFQLAPASSISLDQAYDAFEMNGNGWTLALNNKSVSDTYFKGAIVSGICSGATRPRFDKCNIGNISIPASTLIECGIGGTITFIGTGDYILVTCSSTIAGTATPIINMGGAIGTTNLSMRRYSGGIEIQNMGQVATDTMSLEGDGQLVLNANCAAGTIAIRGNFTITDNSGNVTLSENARYDVDQVADAVWDEVLSGATHNITNSAGRKLRALAGQIIREEQAQRAGANSNQIQLDAGASALDGAYDPSQISIIGGTGSGQSRMILEYDGGTKIATVDRNWKVNPAADSDFIITTHPGREHVNEGLARAGTNNTIQLNALASSDDNAYVSQVIFLRSGLGEDQARTVIAYDGTTKIATVHTNWNVNPDGTTAYVMLPAQVYQQYDKGAVWLDTVNGVAGIVNYFNGTATLPIDTLADARTVADSLKLTKYEVSASSILTLDAAYNNWVFCGNGYIVALNSQSISNSWIQGAVVTGVCTAASRPRFELCNVQNLTCPQFTMIRSGIAGTFTLSTGDYYFMDCFTGKQNETEPVFDFGGAVGNTLLYFERFSGFIELQNMNQSGADEVCFEGWGKIKINANCTGGTIRIRGNVEVDDNSGGNVTIVDDARVELNNIWQGITLDGKTPDEIMQLIMSMVDGRFTKAGNVYTLYKRDNSTVLTTLTISTTARTRS